MLFCTHCRGAVNWPIDVKAVAIKRLVYTVCEFYLSSHRHAACDNLPTSSTTKLTQHTRKTEQFLQHCSTPFMCKLLWRKFAMTWNEFIKKCKYLYHQLMLLSPVVRSCYWAACSSPESIMVRSPTRTSRRSSDDGNGLLVSFSSWLRLLASTRKT